MNQMEHTQHSGMDSKQYRKLLLMTVLSFIAMYFFMYAMINNIGNFYNNVNMFYMAGLMAMPMVIFEVIIMRSMYRNKKLNALIIGASTIALALFYLCIRVQAGVGDKQFLRGMIPHHAAAILMSEKYPSQDPDIKKLQQEIISSQQEEIKVMKAKLEELESK